MRALQHHVAHLHEEQHARCYHPTPPDVEDHNFLVFLPSRAPTCSRSATTGPKALTLKQSLTLAFPCFGAPSYKGPEEQAADKAKAERRAENRVEREKRKMRERSGGGGRGKSSGGKKGDSGGSGSSNKATAVPDENSDEGAAGDKQKDSDPASKVAEFHHMYCKVVLAGTAAAVIQLLTADPTIALLDLVFETLALTVAKQKIVDYRTYLLPNANMGFFVLRGLLSYREYDPPFLLKNVSWPFSLPSLPLWIQQEFPPDVISLARALGHATPIVLGWVQDNVLGSVVGQGVGRALFYAQPLFYLAAYLIGVAVEGEMTKWWIKEFGDEEEGGGAEAAGEEDRRVREVSVDGKKEKPREGEPQLKKGAAGDKEKDNPDENNEKTEPPAED
mmetsp:Transcript_9476/g.23271  ORF Transcript_9476/g.23271 Transcript_9476/m.23271 type:complete len:390 (-) Transcript_9476:153-1322(-)|eukprot:CAMPEP_0178988712 /NCGR_PEP_ID=MMETSP0795-20121207/3956_1 /TAXON_ID=88552 /ORGANISM="Amoebophrya sp., Strain Ameob2" /LENGTH=389 /DNA_ID=CAMNT_0020680003 /DNA_START=211 /DNA_END=1380 /DNA_ORIENTATION=-